MTPELQVVDERYKAPTAYERMLELAIGQNAPIEQLERLLDLKRQQEEYEAKKAYYQAVADFKSRSVVVKNDKKNIQFGSGYSSLGNMLDTVNPVLGEHGLSVSFPIRQNDKMITVCCELRHRDGYSESIELSAPPDVSGGNSKNPIQQIKSTITYLRAATFCAVLGLASKDADLDDDGNASSAKFITPDQCNELNALVTENKLNADGKWLGKFLAYLNVESFEVLPASKFVVAKSGIRDTLKMMVKK